MSTTERASKAGHARAAALTPERRKEISSRGYLSAAVTAIVNRAPELTPAQVERLRAIFGGASE